MIVSPDTNVWIAFLRRQAAAKPLRRLLEAGQVEVHPLVLAELVLGNLGPNSRQLIADIERLVLRSPASHDEAMAFALSHGLAGSGIGYVDVHLVASAHEQRQLLWSLDRSVRRVAGRLGLAFDGSANSPLI